DYRRIGLGNLLLNQLLCHAEKYFEVIVLHADTKQGDLFYTANGFVKGGLYKGSSHYKLL
ncbi:GNAT family N-acetyltransferase, partial [Bacillus thuringiensis]|nr:GNAT family N-acetyltransferase [Bacillus thuringiensis]